METQTYNGWTNRATWLVPLHFEDFFNDMIRDEIESNDGDKEKALSNIRDNIEITVKEIFDEEVEKITNSFVKDLIVLDDINYTEIAENLSEDIFKEYFQEKIDEAIDLKNSFDEETNERDIESCEIEIERLKELMNS